MSDLFWPGDHRAGTLFSGRALVEAMIRVEQAWLTGLATAGIAPLSDPHDLAGLVEESDLPVIAHDAEVGGNPVIPLVALLRERRADANPEASRWLHRGLTSQDVLDTAIQLCARDTLDRLALELKSQTDALAGLAVAHEDTVMAGRTLTQYAVPTTFGLKCAGWLSGLLDARDDLDRVRAGMPAQLGGAAGSLAAVVELATHAGLAEPETCAMSIADGVAEDLGLRARAPWHTARGPVTRLGDVLVTCTDAWGRIANDVLVLARPEIAELAEPAPDGRGGSSTMPQKRNPVLSVLIRRAALSTPPLASTLHLAAAEAVDERPDGGWHLEWSALRTLARTALVAGSQTTELLHGLDVDTARMRLTAEAAADVLLSEQRSMATLFDTEPTAAGPDDYLGASTALIGSVIDRARRSHEKLP
jgi:3-carboxy-cis,cis-muconate cycloisomerase